MTAVPSPGPQSDAPTAGPSSGFSRLGLVLWAGAAVCLVAAGLVLWNARGAGVFTDVLAAAIAWCC